MKAPERPQKELIPAGTYRAVCYAVVDLGTHLNEAFGKNQRQLKIQWEIPDIRIEYEKDGQKKEGPKVVGKTYTFSMYEKADLFQHVNSWTNEANDDFEFESLIGKNCLLNIIHKTNKSGTRKYDVVSSVMAIPTNTQVSQPENPTIFYSITDHGKDIPDSVYDWMVEIIKDSNEFSMMENAGEILNDQHVEDTTDYSNEDDIPF